MEFWGMELPVKQHKAIKFTENAQFLHLTQAALGLNPKDGERVVLQIGFGNRKFVLGTLVKSTCDQIHLDLVVDKDFTLEHTGSAPIFVAGYITSADLDMGPDEETDEDEEEDEEDEEHEGDEEEEEAVVNAATGNGISDKKGAKADAKGVKAKLAMKAVLVRPELVKRRKGAEDEDDDEDEEGDDESDEDEDDEAAVLRGAKDFEDMDDDDDLDEEDDEFADGLADEDDDDDDDDIEEGDFDDDDEDEDDESDDMDEDEEAVENAQPPPKSAKRPAAEAKTPATQKKAKLEAATPKTPAATAKTPGKDKTPAQAKTPKTPGASGTLGKYQCQECNKNFQTETALTQHNTAKHK